MSTEHTKLGTEQVTTGPEGQKQEITLEVGTGPAQSKNGRVDLMVSIDYTDGEDRLATASLTRDELWEHVHNCLEALTRLPKGADNV